jgi:uncharacterized protein with GYD domain
MGLNYFRDIRIPLSARNEVRSGGQNWRCHVPKYLLQVSYTAEGARGLQKDGGSKRRAAANALVESVGGKLETFYYALGSTDVFATADLPDAAAAAAVSMTIAASGAAAAKTTALLTVDEIDGAVKKSAKYTPPGR